MSCHSSFRLLARAFALVALLAVAVHAAPALATTYTVSNTNDSGPGSLRQALLDANNHAGADTIWFIIGTGAQTISPTSKPIPIRIRARRQSCPRSRLESPARSEANDTNAAGTLGHEEPAIRRERDRPRRLEAARDELHVLDDGRTDPR